MLRHKNDYAPYVTIAGLWISACVAKAFGIGSEIGERSAD
jgi:hypothetical protein